MNTFKVSLNTPKELFCELEAQSAVFPGLDGEIGILAGHMPMVMCFKTGKVRFVTGNGTEVFVCEEGFCEIENNVLTVFTNHCCRENETEKAEKLLNKSRAEAVEHTKSHRRNEIKIARIVGDL